MQISQKTQITKSATSFNISNTHNNINPAINNNKISPTSVYHLVNNNNNKNDNTLKKRNALVAFEFKTLLDKVTPHNPSIDTNLEDENRETDVVCELLPSPPYIYSDHHGFDLSIANNAQNHSPPSLSSSSSSSSSSSPSSSSSSASNSQASSQNRDKETREIRAISPSQLIRAPRVASPNGLGNKSLLTEINTNDRTQPQVINLRSKSQVISHGVDNFETNKTYENQHNHIILNNGHFIGDVHNPHHYTSVTIWREELNAKNNVQEQIKKQVFIYFFVIFLIFFY